MTPILASLQIFLLAALLLTVLASLGASIAVPLVGRATKGASPEVRHRALLLLAVSPVILASSGMVAAVAPSVLGLVWPAYDHCPIHGGGHAHLCLVHLPKESGSPASWLCLSAVLSLVSARVLAGGMQLYRARSLCSRLLARGAEAPRLSAAVIPTASPLCMSVGILKPRTVLSEGFLRAIDPQQLEAVLVHERAHATRRDALHSVVARATTAFMLPPARRKLLRELEIAAEQSCDEAAAGAIGDRLTMAEVILKVERLVGAAPFAIAPLAVSFGGTAIALRVASLLAPPAPRERTHAAIAVLSCAAVAIVAAAEPLHHLTETVIGTLVH